MESGDDRELQKQEISQAVLKSYTKQLNTMVVAFVSGFGACVLMLVLAVILVKVLR